MQIGICVFSVLDLSPDYINVWCGTALHSPQRRGRPPALGRRGRAPASTARAKHRRTRSQTSLHWGQAPSSQLLTTVPVHFDVIRTPQAAM